MTAARATDRRPTAAGQQGRAQRHFFGGLAWQQRVGGVWMAAGRQLVGVAAASRRRMGGVWRAISVEILTFLPILLAIYISNVYLCGVLVNI